MSDFYNSVEIKTAYVGKRAKDFNYLITAQAENVYRRCGIIFPVVASSTVAYLYRNGPAALADIAKALEHPHQTIAQHTESLTKARLAIKKPDPNDGRRSNFHLTAKGRDQAARLEMLSEEAANVFQELFDEIGLDLSDALEKAHKALKERPLEKRFLIGESIKQAG